MALESLITPGHVVGLAVAQGCFHAESRPDPRYRLGWRVRATFWIEMPRAQRQVLEAVRDHLGCGKVYDLAFARYAGYHGRTWLPHSRYQVCRVRELEDVIVPFFRANPLFGPCAESFETFALLVAVLASKRHRSPHGLAVARELAGRLREQNAREHLAA